MQARCSQLGVMMVMAIGGMVVRVGAGMMPMVLGVLVVVIVGGGVGLRRKMLESHMLPDTYGLELGGEIPREEAQADDDRCKKPHHE